MEKQEIQTKYLICDLDGCLIDTAYIWEIVKAFNFSKDEAFDFFNRTANAEVNKIDLPLFKYLCFKASGGLKIHFMTARSELIEVETINFIQKKTGLIFGKEFTISFRPSNDVSSPAESKKARIEAMLANGKEIAFAIDDEDEVLRMYAQKGIKAIKWIIGFIPVSVGKEFGSQFNNLINEKEEQCLN